MQGKEKKWYIYVKNITYELIYNKWVKDGEAVNEKYYYNENLWMEEYDIIVEKKTHKSLYDVYK